MMMPFVLGWLTILSGTLAAAGIPSATQPETPHDGVEWGRESLESHSDLPWYNPGEDRLQRIDVAPHKDDENRRSPWEAAEKKAAQSTSNRAARDGSGFWTVMETLAWIVLGSLLGLLIWLLVRAAMRSDLARGGGEKAADAAPLAKNRIEELPVPVSPQHHDLLSVARAYQAAGDFAKAIIYAFAHQLVELDRHHLIQLSKGKTNRQYLAELRKQPVFTQLLRPTMLAFEDVFFGHHDLSPQRFQACWDDLDRFHQQLEQVAS